MASAPSSRPNPACTTSKCVWQRGHRSTGSAVVARRCSAAPAKRSVAGRAVVAIGVQLVADPAGQHDGAGHRESRRPRRGPDRPGRAPDATPPRRRRWRGPWNGPEPAVIPPESPSLTRLARLRGSPPQSTKPPVPQHESHPPPPAPASPPTTGNSCSCRRTEAARRRRRCRADVRRRRVSPDTVGPGRARRQPGDAGRAGADRGRAAGWPPSRRRPDGQPSRESARSPTAAMIRVKPAP